MPRLVLAVLPLLLLLSPLAAHAGADEPAVPSRYYGGFAVGIGAGAASVEGARLEFGTGKPAIGMAGRLGLVLSPRLLLGLHLDAAGASSGRVVSLGPCIPGSVCPQTTAHRVAVNHWSVVGTWRPEGGPVLLRAGGGLAESFTEDWASAAPAVRRSFGPGVVAGAGSVVWSIDTLRITLNADLMRGWYGTHTSWAGMGTVGVEVL